MLHEMVYHWMAKDGISHPSFSFWPEPRFPDIDNSDDDGFTKWPISPGAHLRSPQENLRESLAMYPEDAQDIIAMYEWVDRYRAWADAKGAFQKATHKILEQATREYIALAVAKLKRERPHEFLKRVHEHYDYHRNMSCPCYMCKAVKMGLIVPYDRSPDDRRE